MILSLKILFGIVRPVSYTHLDVYKRQITGRLALRFGELKLFIISVSLFSLASLCCGLSNSLDVLIFFRVIQGLVAGPLIPLRCV